MSLLERVKKVRQRFIEYYERGETDPVWLRSLSTYRTWAFNYVAADGSHAVFCIWDRVMDDYALGYQPATYDDIMRQFDLMERYAVWWVFS